MIRPGLICLIACLFGFAGYWIVNRPASRGSWFRFAYPLAIIGCGIGYLLNGLVRVESMAPFLTLGLALALLAILPIGADEPVATTNSITESHHQEKGNEGL